MNGAVPVGWDDAAARSRCGHVLQSSAWARIREAQGWRAEYVRVGEPLPVALVLWRALPLGSVAYVPRGPIVAPGDARGLADALGALAALARARGALFLKVDPELAPEEAAPALAAAGFRRAPDVQPVLATLVLDLAADEEALLAGCDKDTRWSVRQGPKRGVTVREATTGDDDLRAFHALYAGTGARAGFVTRTWAYYRLVWSTLIAAGLATLRLAEIEGRAVAAAMTWRCGERDVYMYGATSKEGRTALAAYPLQWECILAAKRRGAARYDLGGVPVDLARTDDPMRGPYVFKKGFGGSVVRFAGAHDVAPRRLAYGAYRTLEPLYTRALRLAARR